MLYLLGLCNYGIAQNGAEIPESKNLIQFSGYVLSSDSLKPLSYAVITIPGTRRGAVSDINGFFNFVAKKGDHIVFHFIGYEPSTFTIPDTLTEYKYNIIKLLAPDTVYYDEILISALPSRELFNEVFLHTEVPDDDLTRAERNLRNQELRDRSVLMAMDGTENQNQYLRNQAQKYYTAGQMPQQQILNPLAWMKLIDAIKNGKFKQK